MQNTYCENCPDPDVNLEKFRHRCQTVQDLVYSNVKNRLQSVDAHAFNC